MNYTFIKRQSILSLFRVVSSTENTYRKMRVSELFIGLLGIGFILFGYKVSTRLFSGAFTAMNELFLAMVLILGSVILGTYLFYKGSVSAIFNLVRKAKGGYLSLNEVLSLSSIMFRMKSNALLLTIITTVSALAIGLLSLSYISYYSAEKSAEQSVPNHFSMMEPADVAAFGQALRQANIEYRETKRAVLMVDADVAQVIGVSTQDGGNGIMTLPVVSEKSVDGVDVALREALFMGLNDAMTQFMAIRPTGELTLKGQTDEIKLSLIGMDKMAVVSIPFSGGCLRPLWIKRCLNEWRRT